MPLLGQPTNNIGVIPNNSIGFNQILGTDWPGTFGMPGYIKLPNGLIVQWAKINIPTVASGAGPNWSPNVTWTYPIQFPNQCLAIYGNQIGSPAGPVASEFMAPDAPGKSSTTVCAYMTNGSINTATYYYVLALGY